jgi:hypothetical protein
MLELYMTIKNIVPANGGFLLSCYDDTKTALVMVTKLVAWELTTEGASPIGFDNCSDNTGAYVIDADYKIFDIFGELFSTDATSLDEAIEICCFGIAMWKNGGFEKVEYPPKRLVVDVKSVLDAANK